MKMHNSIKGIGGVISLLAVTATLAQSLSVEDAEGWEQSASSRNANAITLEQDAAGLLDSAQDYREREYLYEAERQSNQEQAGDHALRAGEWEVTAAIHYEKAVDNWGRAAEIYGALGKTEAQAQANEHKESARQAARLALTRAIGNFESAAEAFNDFNAAVPDKQRIAGQKAESVRGQLAAQL